MRLGRWKYLRDGAIDMLFDLDGDPGERDDRSYREPARLADLRARVTRWEQEVDASAVEFPMKRRRRRRGASNPAATVAFGGQRDVLCFPPRPMRRTTRPTIARCLHRLTLAVALALAIPATALAQRQMHWDRLDIFAHLDANGALTVTETQTIVFTGDWNGGERRFDVRGRQRLRFLGMSRLEEGRRIGLGADDRIDDVDEYAWPETNLLRWRSRRSTDPLFARTPIRYELRYVLSNVLKQDGEGYRLDHDFAFPDRSGVIGQFTVRLTADPAWALPADFPERHSRNNLTPRTGFVLHVPLTYAGTSPPVVEPPRPLAIVIGVCVLLGLTTLAVLGFFVREERTGRFEPLTEAVDEPWLREHVLRYPAEIVGAAWDESIDKPEVVALLARLVAEGVLVSEVSQRSLLLRLNVDRATLSGYTRTLVDRLFFDGRTETSPSIVSEHYRDEGFNPVHVIRRDLQAAVDEALPPPPEPGLSRAVSVGLFALGFLLLGLAIATGDIRASHAFFGGIVTFVVIAIGAATGLTGRTQLEWGRRAALFSLGPPLAVAAATAAGLWFYGGPEGAALRGLSVAAIVTLALAVTNSLINTLKSRQHPDAMRFRKNLTAARAYFAAQLESGYPNLRHEWYPWLLAFGLEWEPESWSTTPRRVAPDERRRRYVDDRSAWTESSPVQTAPARWAGFGGGRSGGGGGGASWATAAGGFAGSVSARRALSSSDSSSNGSGSSWSSSDSGSSYSSSDSSSSSSGGGGGGGW